MLYNKSAVKDRKPVSKRVERAVEGFGLFELKARAREEVTDLFSSKGFQGKRSPLKRLEGLARTINLKITHDGHYHMFPGVRGSNEVWDQKKGHCIENFCLFFAASSFLVPDLKGRRRILLTKNPKEVDCGFGEQYGVHPFMVVHHKGKKYMADAVFGRVVPFRPQDFVGTQYVSKREFVSFWLQEAAEDLSFSKDEHDLALEFIKGAQVCDPNNYTVQVTKGEILFNKMFDMHREKDKKGEESCWRNANMAYRHAISMAPDLLDVWKFYGDFQYETYCSRRWAIQTYKKALQRETIDAHVLRCLNNRLFDLGQEDLCDQVEKMEMKLEARKARRKAR